MKVWKTKVNKGLGRNAQIRGHKRKKKVLNRKLNRNASDLKKNAGSYDKWFMNKIKTEINNQTEKKEENNA